MEFIEGNSIGALANPSVVSRQLLSPENSASQRVTITEVHLEPGASQPRHIHEASEQIWYGLQGRGALLLADGKEQAFQAGYVVRFEVGDIHGLRNGEDEEFVYLSVTAPPLNFRHAYQEKM